MFQKYDFEKHMRYERRDWYADGKVAGRAEGREEGREEGMNLVNSLSMRLLEDGRIEDLRRSSRDKDYQNALLTEYNLIK